MASPGAAHGVHRCDVHIVHTRQTSRCDCGKSATKRVPRDVQLAVLVLLVVEVLDGLVHLAVRLPHRFNALLEALIDACPINQIVETSQQQTKRLK